MKKNTIGFTLVELLVVVAIIGILASLLLPSLKAAREMGKSAKCTSNLRQLVLTAHSYAQDHDGKLPASVGYDPSVEDASSWHFYPSVLEPYLSGKKGSYGGGFKAFYCPYWPWQDVTGKPSPYCATGGLDSQSPNYAFVTYSVFTWVLRTNGTHFDVMAAEYSAGTVTQIRPESLERHSDIMLFACSSAVVGGTVPSPPGMILYEDIAANSELTFRQCDPLTAGFYHQGKRNFGFLDGHVESLTRTAAANRSPW